MTAPDRRADARGTYGYIQLYIQMYAVCHIPIVARRIDAAHVSTRVWRTRGGGILYYILLNADVDWMESGSTQACESLRDVRVLVFVREEARAAPHKARALESEVETGSARHAPWRPFPGFSSFFGALLWPLRTTFLMSGLGPRGLPSTQANRAH